MLKKYIGKNRAENLHWLLDVWLNAGPTVCFLQGFSGVGKTDLARDFRELVEKQGHYHHAVINEVADRATPSTLESFMELAVMLSLQGLPEMESVLSEQANPNLGYAVERALRRPVVIILDEAQRLLRPVSGTPRPELNGILGFLRNRPNLPGRLLLLSDRLIEEARWSEWIPRRTLTPLRPEEAIEALDAKLNEAGVAAEVPLERKREVVQDLDFNPRAIEALVGALRYETLDEIIESNPGLWAVRDREVSKDFLRALERDLLERTMGHLGASIYRKLWRLSVHRRSFKREALEDLCGGKDEVSTLRMALISNFLLNHHRGAFAINPIAREIALNHLREDAAEFRHAHSKAADYHLRHFRARQMVGDANTLTASFAELRYHLVQAGRQNDLRTTGDRFLGYLEQQLRFNSSVPSDREELDERIGVLSALLENSCSVALDYYLARCLKARGAQGDIQRAIMHAEQAVEAGAPEGAWCLLVGLKEEVEGADAALTILYRGLAAATLAPTASLYRLGAGILARAGNADKAIALLKDGIKSISPDESSVSLYQACGELLANAGEIDEAVVLLKEGISIISPDKSSVSLYQACGELLAKAGEINEAVMLLKGGIRSLPVDKSSISLYQICGKFLAEAGRISEAVALLMEGTRAIPADKNSAQLYQVCGGLLAKAGKVGEAVALLEDGIRCIPPEKGAASLYQACAQLLAEVGKSEEAIALLKNGLRAIPPNKGTRELYQICAELLAAAGKIKEAIGLLREGIKTVSFDQNLFLLYLDLSELYCRIGNPAGAVECLREGLCFIPEKFIRFRLAEAALSLSLGIGSAALSDMLAASGADALGERDRAFGAVLHRLDQGDWRGGAESARTARLGFPRDLNFAVLEAFCWLASGDLELALEAITSFPGIVFKVGDPHGWLMAFILIRGRSRSDAVQYLVEYLGRSVDESRELKEAFLLRLWDEQEAGPKNHRLCGRFPLMPPSLTGLARTVRRTPFSRPVMPVSRLAGSVVKKTPGASRPRTPDVYVSYAWGEDLTEEGRRREEVVGRLCATLRAHGYEVGRDRERLNGGDSIEAFAQEISKAKRIVAVISAKYLHSDYCMPRELFRAYRRVDFQNVEFREKVIALVMDDARPLLEDLSAILDLTDTWMQKLEKLQSGSEKIDPSRKDSDLWDFIVLLKEMIERLPGMLSALKDTVMKRGFDEIVSDGFQEVISRLPPEPVSDD